MNAFPKFEVPATQYTLICGEQIKQQPAPKWIVRGLIPEKGVSALYGPPGSGKTFLVLDLALAVCQGVAWFKHATTQRPVIYLALEGHLSSRLKAWSVRDGDLPPDFWVIQGQVFCFNIASDVDGLIHAIKQQAPNGALVIFDTLARAAAGSDENSSRDMGLVMQAAGRVSEETNSSVLVVHHSGKNQDAGLRGSSALLGAMDAVLRVSPGKPRSVTVEKSKEGAAGGIVYFELDMVKIGTDPLGHEIQSCVVRECGAGERGLGVNQELLFKAINEALEQAKTGVPYAPPEAKALTDKEVRSLAKVHGMDRRRVSEALEPLLRRGTFATGGPVPPQPGNLGRSLWIP